MKEGFRPRLILERPTAGLKKLQRHTSTLIPWAGYAPHADPLSCLDHHAGRRSRNNRQASVGLHDVIFYRAGEPHGINNAGTTVVRYVIFEFHDTPHSWAENLAFSIMAEPLLFQRLRDSYAEDGNKHSGKREPDGYVEKAGVRITPDNGAGDGVAVDNIKRMLGDGDQQRHVPGLAIRPPLAVTVCIGPINKAKKEGQQYLKIRSPDSINIAVPNNLGPILTVTVPAMIKTV